MKKEAGSFFLVNHNCSVLFLAWWLTLAATAQAATVRLQDGATVEGDVLQVDDEGVVVQLPRERVTAIDGRPLPVALASGITAPGFTVRDIQHRAWTVGTGDKITLLHFWVQWCPHCRSDAKGIQALYDRFHDNPRVQILSINLDRERALAERFVQEHHATYPVVSAAEQAKAPGGVDLTERYQIAAFPVTYLIDAQGVIRQKIMGSFAETGRDVGAMIERLLK